MPYGTACRASVINPSMLYTYMLNELGFLQGITDCGFQCLALWFVTTLYLACKGTT